MTAPDVPPWDAPLDPEAFLRSIPAGALIKGMFPGALAAEARRRGIPLPTAADKYLPFYEYPLRDHMRLVVDAARGFWPELHVRQGLRKVGRAAVTAFTQTTFGKAVLGGFNQPETMARALSSMVRAFGTSLSKPTPHLEVVQTADTTCVLRFRDAWLLLDCHQVGIIEGYCHACGVRPDVKVAVISPSSADFLVSWEVVRPSTPSPRTPSSGSFGHA
ncbi:MAG TPA: DUF2378 family protein [Polyangiaceae bacterium]|jgi:uncharacterized protein (TIGR02265 family)